MTLLAGDNTCAIEDGKVMAPGQGYGHQGANDGCRHYQ